MPTYRKRGNKWRVEVSVKGTRSSATFSTKREAQAWAAEESVRLNEKSENTTPDKTFGDLLDRYMNEITPTKRSIKREKNMIQRLIREDALSKIHLRDIKPTHIAEWRDSRLQSVSPGSVIREMVLLSHACNIARREWGWLQDNPVSNVSRPKTPKARTRRPTADETEALLISLGYHHDAPPKTAMARVGAAYLFACETAMRAGEICSLEWENTHEKYAHLPMTKNGYSRDVPLSAEARRIIKQLRAVTANHKTVFNLNNGQLDALFRKAKAMAMIQDLHFHDTRREALTRLSRIFSVMELARISGHRDLRILQNVYYSPTVDDLASKLDSQTKI